MSEEASKYGSEPTYIAEPSGSKGMTLNEYQQIALETAVYPEEYNIIYPALGMAGEAGEVADKVKKVIRDNNGNFTSIKCEEIAMEIGDVLWYCAVLAEHIGYRLDTIARMNNRKLKSRQLRGKLGGNGDNR
jgi:mazG nucleotide pyrophosphohydrolase domain protein